MKRSESLFRFVAGRVVLGSCLFVGISAVTPGLGLFAQQRGPVQRILQGRVMDKSATLLPGAVVYLKDGHSLSVKSFISNDQGTYRFGQLAQNTDYEVWAEINGRKSPVKTISSFDSKNQITIDLKIDTEK
jgi:hypothetical protein